MTDLYFQTLSQALKQAGVCTPTLVIDKERLDRNIDQLINVLNRGFDYRLVAKSLPAIPLLQYIMRRTGSMRLMSFHLPFLMDLVEHLPGSDILMGKPMPVCAARHFYAWHGQQGSSMCFAPETQLQWLIDTPKRLAQYEELAKELNVKMCVSLEIDVGLHRGGFKADADFVATLKRIAHSPWLTLSGLMGYEAHISKLPAFLGGTHLAFQAVTKRYRHFLHVLTETLGPQAIQDLCINTGGSSTYSLYENTSAQVATEIATASALVKPTDFDVPTLDHHLPAAFIAAPVLKRVRNPEIPEAPKLSWLLRMLGKLPKEGCYIYGGNWLATPCYPQAKASELLGRSSNQEFYELPSNSGLTDEDYLFFRPKQSEAVMLQFGKLAVYEQGKIVDWWPVLQYPDGFLHSRPQPPAKNQDTTHLSERE